MGWVRPRKRHRQSRKPGHTGVPPEVTESAAQLRAEFETKFGRPPGPDDPLIFDPNADTPQPMNVADIETMFTDFANKLGWDQATIYAMQQTGMLIPPELGPAYSDEDVAEFEEAREKYRRLHG